MPEVMQRREQPGLARPADSLSPDAVRARAFLAAGLVWAGVVVVAWLFWWQIGDSGREGIANTVGLTSAQLSPYVVTALVVEKIATKGLLIAALFYWVKSRWSGPFERAWVEVFPMVFKRATPEVSDGTEQRRHQRCQVRDRCVLRG